MAEKSKKYKIIALILALVILSTSIPLTIWGVDSMKSNPVTLENASSEDKRIASEISNETGLSIEEVFEFKSHGRTWNEVLSILRNKSTLGENSKKKDRDALLLNSGLDAEFLDKLRKEGFSDNDITEVKLIEERVVFQLEEITSKTIENPSDSLVKPNPSKPSNQFNQVNGDKLTFDADKTSADDDISAYQQLYEKIDVKNAIYFMLKLKSDFESYEKVLDEYLFSLQTELDLNDYIKDKETYIKNRDEKKLLLDDQKVITLEKIETKSIDKTQADDKENELTSNQSQTTNKSSSDATAKETSPLPDVPEPNSEDIKPKNPTDEIMNEINGINPMENQK